MGVVWQRIECQGVFATVMPIPDALGFGSVTGDLLTACLVQRQSQPQPGPKAKVRASRGDLGSIDDIT